MRDANSLWAPPRIHGELQKLRSRGRLRRSEGVVQPGARRHENMAFMALAAAWFL